MPLGTVVELMLRFLAALSALAGLGALVPAHAGAQDDEDPGTALTSGPLTPVKLLQGPLVFRLRGARQAPVSSDERYFRYAMVLRLSRDPRVVWQDGDARPKTDGTYRLAGISVDDLFYGLGPASRRCYVGYIAVNSDRETVRPLRGVPIGRRVATTVRPTAGVSTDQDQPRYARTYRRQAVLRSGDLNLRSRAVRAQLRRIGCAR